MNRPLVDNDNQIFDKDNNNISVDRENYEGVNHDIIDQVSPLQAEFGRFLFGGFLSQEYSYFMIVILPLYHCEQKIFAFFTEKGIVLVTQRILYFLFKREPEMIFIPYEEIKEIHLEDPGGFVKGGNGIIKLETILTTLELKPPKKKFYLALKDKIIALKQIQPNIRIQSNNKN